MSKGKYTKKQKRGFPVWLLLVILAAALGLAAVMVWGGEGAAEPTETEGGAPVPAQQTGQTETAAPTEGPSVTTAPEVSGEADATEPEQTTAPTQTQPPQTIPTQPTVAVIQQQDAEYEGWLAAAMVVCLSMEYPDFELEGIYTPSATALADKYSSRGVYVIFTSGGSRMALHSMALTEERTASGTRDISTETIGYATFDLVDPAALELSSMEEIAVEDLGELIGQSLLASIYTH